MVHRITVIARRVPRSMFDDEHARIRRWISESGSMPSPTMKLRWVSSDGQFKQVKGCAETSQSWPRLRLNDRSRSRLRWRRRRNHYHVAAQEISTDLSTTSQKIRDKTLCHIDQ